MKRWITAILLAFLLLLPQNVLAQDVVQRYFVDNIEGRVVLMSDVSMGSATRAQAGVTSDWVTEAFFPELDNVEDVGEVTDVEIDGADAIRLFTAVYVLEGLQTLPVFTVVMAVDTQMYVVMSVNVSMKDFFDIVDGIITDRALPESLDGYVRTDEDAPESSPEPTNTL